MDVELAVAVDVRQRPARRPSTGFGDAGVLRDVAKLKVAEVQVELRAVLVGGEDDLGQAVAGEVAEGHAAAVVKVAVGEDVQVAGVGETIREADAGVARGEERSEEHTSELQSLTNL